jgi:hypothetical protein
VHVTLDIALELATVCLELRHDWQASMDREHWLARVGKAAAGSPWRAATSRP